MYCSGVGTTRWKIVQTAGRLGRKPCDAAIFITVVERKGAIPNFATEKEQKRNFLDFNDVTLVVVDIKSERFVKSTCLQQDLFDMTMVTIMFDTKTSESESFIDRSIEGIINIMMEFHHF